MLGTNTPFAALRGTVYALFLVCMAHVNAAAAADALAVKTIAEVESKSTENGRSVVKLVPADRVVSGDRVIYTLEVRNVGATAVVAPAVIEAIPDHMRYIADSAVGPGAEVTYSVDGGHRFAPADALKVEVSDGPMRPALAADYTHIQWKLKNDLKANSVAFLRFRAVVK